MDNVEELGVKAYQKSLWGDYKGAIAILTKAITKHPFDERLYNDRSFYYYKLKNYTLSLEDAEFMLKLFPTYLRAHLRKGEVLMDLKKYEEAESVFRDLLGLDPDNKAATFYLLEAQICQLTKDGKYWVQDAKRALQLNNFSTKQAKLYLEFEGGNSVNNYDRSEVYYSDEEWEEPPSVSRKPDRWHGCGDRPSNDDDYDPCKDPSNPFQSNALWVGNVTTKVTEQDLRAIFSKYGKIRSIAVQHKNGCAFVNYFHPCMASNAMRNLHLEDTALVIRFPDKFKTRITPNFSSKTPKKN